MVFDVKAYNNLEEMLDDLNAAQTLADSLVKKWQKEQLTPGTKFICLYDELTVWGEILDIEDYYSSDPEEREYEESLWKQPHMENYRFTRCYSKIVPEGKLGDIHISTVHFLATEEAFEKARKNGWPTPNLPTGKL